MPSSKTNRDSKPKVKMNKYQTEIIINYMIEHPEVQKNKLTNDFTAEKRDKMWTELAEILNQEGGPSKSMGKWQRSWTDYKSGLRAKASRNKREANKTGGGSAKIKPLTALEERALPLAQLDMTYGLASVAESQRRNANTNSQGPSSSGTSTRIGEPSQCNEVPLPSDQPGCPTLPDSFTVMSELPASCSYTLAEDLTLPDLTVADLPLTIELPQPGSFTVMGDLPASCSFTQEEDLPLPSELPQPSNLPTNRQKTPAEEARLGSVSTAPRRKRQARGVAINSEKCSSLIQAHFAQAEGMCNVAKAIEAYTSLWQKQLEVANDMEKRKVECLQQLVAHFTNK